MLDNVGHCSLRPLADLASLSDDIEAAQFDIGTTAIRLVRVGNVIQIVFSSPLEAKYLYRELAEKYKRAEERLGGE